MLFTLVPSIPTLLTFHQNPSVHTVHLMQFNSSLLSTKTAYCILSIQPTPHYFPPKLFIASCPLQPTPHYFPPKPLIVYCPLQPTPHNLLSTKTTHCSGLIVPKPLIAYCPLQATPHYLLSTKTAQYILFSAPPCSPSLCTFHQTPAWYSVHHNPIQPCIAYFPPEPLSKDCSPQSHSAHHYLLSTKTLHFIVSTTTPSNCS